MDFPANIYYSHLAMVLLESVMLIHSSVWEEHVVNDDT